MNLTGADAGPKTDSLKLTYTGTMEKKGAACSAPQIRNTATLLRRSTPMRTHCCALPAAAAAELGEEAFNSSSFSNKSLGNFTSFATAEAL